MKNNEGFIQLLIKLIEGKNMKNTAKKYAEALALNLSLSEGNCYVLHLGCGKENTNLEALAYWVTTQTEFKERWQEFGSDLLIELTLKLRSVIEEIHGGF